MPQKIKTAIPSCTRCCWVYLFRCKDGSLYCGSTRNIKNREQLHNAGRGSKYVRSRGGGKIVYCEKHATKNRALCRECEIKRWPKTKKEKLITSRKPS